MEISCLCYTACCDYGISMDKWLSKLDASGWMSYIKDAITCACVAAQCIDKEGSYFMFFHYIQHYFEIDF